MTDFRMPVPIICALQKIIKIDDGAKLAELVSVNPCEGDRTIGTKSLFSINTSFFVIKTRAIMYICLINSVVYLHNQVP